VIDRVASFNNSKEADALPVRHPLEEARDVAGGVRRERRGEIDHMGVILLVLLLVLLFAGLGFALHLLWIIAAVLLAIWIVGFLVSGAEHSWYRVQRK
jgi:type IV secretory pathway TrbD component